MPAGNVNWPAPLTRFPTLWPGQMGVPGTDNDRGERMHPTGQVFYVDPNFPGAADNRVGTSPTAPLRTIAHALTLVRPQRGDVIVVGANDYWNWAPGGRGVSTDYITPITEEVTIPYTASGVRIVGLSSGTMGVMWQPASNGGTCITVHAIDVIIEGFLFTEGDYTGCDAIYCEWDGTTLFGENLTVRHCMFDDTVDTAIQLEYSWYCDIHNNLFWRCDEYGIYADVAGTGIEYCTIHDNLFHDVTTTAISLLGGCNYNHIYNNNIYNSDAQSGGVATDVGITTAGGLSNQVFNNWFSCLLPVPANGDWNNMNTGAATDAWIANYCMNGMATTNPT
jgi:hypothetical protein